VSQMTPEQMQLKREALQSLVDNPTLQLLLTKLQAQQRNKRREQREAAFKNETAVAFGCEWALWGLEQTEIILSQLRDETKDRPEKTMRY